MLFNTDSQSLNALRHRFLIEKPERVNDWLWGEHPQISAFILNWVGDVEKLSGFLKPLSMDQRTDILYRISQLDPGLTPSPFQEDILVEALRQVSPYLMEAGEELAREDTPPQRGYALFQGYLNTQPREGVDKLLARLEDYDGVLARLSGSLYGYSTGGSESSPPSFYGLLNTYCDLLNYHFGVLGLQPALVYQEGLEMISAEKYMEDMKGEWLAFQAKDVQNTSVFYMMASPQLFYHFLEASFSAAKPMMFHNILRPKITFLEKEVALAFTRTLVDYLFLVLFQKEARDTPQVMESDDQAMVEDMGRMGKTPLVAVRFGLKFGHTQAGNLELLLTPPLLEALTGLWGEGLFQEVVGPLLADGPSQAKLADTGTTDHPSHRPGPPAKKEKPAKKKSGPSQEGPDSATGSDSGEISRNLEQYLWENELEEAENQSGQPSGVEETPFDLLLKGYSIGEIATLEEKTVQNREWMADIHYFYGSRLLQEKLYQDAAEALERSVAADPDHIQAQLLLAAAWGESGFYFKEILAYKTLIAKGRCIPEVYVLLSRRLSFLRRVDQAFDAMRKALDHGFQHREVLNNDVCFQHLRNSTKWRQYLAQNP
ncbi:MAG: hypothetical protein OEW12_05950 [Deltaproteobacteria bacterium]|nr:hypothetical protein [Deltaproteobacteria bacterium]